MIDWTKFKTTKKEYLLIDKIAVRAMSLHVTSTFQDLIMDLECAFNDLEFDLEKLYTFPESDFLHDVCGIKNNINRETGKIENCFVPRCWCRVNAIYSDRI